MKLHGKSGLVKAHSKVFEPSKAHSSRIVNRPSRTFPFQRLSVKELTLDNKFEVVNALVISHRQLCALHDFLQVKVKRL